MRTTTMYHASPPCNRYGITREGLRIDLDMGEGCTEPGIYLSPNLSKIAVVRKVAIDLGLYDADDWIVAQMKVGV
jgi:hypothetical protein